MNIAPSVTSSTIIPAVFASLSAIGVLVILLGLTRPVKRQSIFTQSEQREFVKQSEQQALADLFGPLAFRLYKQTDPKKADNIRHMLDLTGYVTDFKTLTDYYIFKLFYASFAIVLGFAIATALVFVAGLPIFLYILIIPLAIIGYQQPDSQLNAAMQARREQMEIEIPEVLETLVVNYAVHESLVQALSQYLNAPNVSIGYLFREFLLMLREHTSSGVRLSQAIKNMGERNKDVPLMDQITQRMLLVEEQGVPLTAAFEEIIARARDRIINKLEERFASNSNLIAIPSAIMLLAIFILVLGLTLSAVVGAFSQLG